MIFINKNICELGCYEADHEFRVVTKDYEYKQFNSDFIYLKCRNCGNLLLDAIPDISEVKNIYPNSYGAYDSNNFGFFGQLARNFAASFKLNRILKNKNKNEIHKAIEFGCGSQPLITKLKEKIGCSITLCDIYLNTNISADKFIQGNLEDEITKIEEKFDLIVFNQVIEHLCRPKQFLDNCNRILNDGGLLYFETPNVNGYDSTLFTKAGLWGGLHAPRHFTIFNDESIKKNLQLDYKHITIGNLLNPFMLNESVKNLIEVKGWIRIKGFFKLSNPLILVSYLSLDILAMMIGFKTGNMNVICKK
jgi:SAM-dependent methyltransferase